MVFGTTKQMGVAWILRSRGFIQIDFVASNPHPTCSDLQKASLILQDSF